MAKQRRQYTAEFKFQVALEAVRGTKTVGQIASEHGVHPTQLGDWKHQLLEEGPQMFMARPTRQAREAAKMETELYEQIGRLKKELPASLVERRAMIEAGHSALSIRRQCELLGLSQASYYYKSATESALNLELMRRIDEQYLLTPFYGWPRMVAHLRRLGYTVNHKRVRRLRRLMGLEAIYPKPRRQWWTRGIVSISLPTSMKHVCARKSRPTGPPPWLQGASDRNPCGGGS